MSNEHIGSSFKSFLAEEGLLDEVEKAAAERATARIEEQKPQPEVITRAEAKRLGLKKYFTGVACKRGHVAERYVANWVCVDCGCNIEEVRAQKRQRSADRYKNDPEFRARKRQRCADRYKTDPEFRARNRQRRADRRKKCPEYEIWLGMIYRCENPNHKHYRHYGGRGIVVCAAWQDFKTFLADMGPRPSPRHSLERIDVNGPYCKENCEWILKRDQPLNTRRSVFIEIDGKRRGLALLARENGLPHHLVYLRFKRGWSVERLFIPPTRQPQRKREEARRVAPPNTKRARLSAEPSFSSMLRLPHHRSAAISSRHQSPTSRRRDRRHSQTRRSTNVWIL